MLRAAGVTFATRLANVDEPAIRAALMRDDGGIAPVAVAGALAAAKACAVSHEDPEALVIGSDQVLAVEGAILAKPGGSDGVRATLKTLSGKTHDLHSAVALAFAGRVVWSASDTARLTMRTLSEPFIADYIARAGSGVEWCVGAYQIEGLGIQLFDEICGDYFTILGMPLLPLLGQLRTEGVLAQ